MSGIGNDMSPLSGNVTTPGQQADREQADRVQVGERQLSQEQADQGTAEATVVELSGPATSATKGGAAAGGVPTGEVPADAEAAGTLANDLAAQIGGSGSQASAAHAPVSPEMTLKLTQP